MDKRAARRRVGALLQRFFAHLTSSLAAGTTELWHKVEGRLAQKPPASEPSAELQVPPGVVPKPTRQPMQQQQAKKAEDAK